LPSKIFAPQFPFRANRIQRATSREETHHQAVEHSWVHQNYKNQSWRPLRKKSPADHHFLDAGGVIFRGQRDPQDRLNLIPIDFADKSVLGIGANQGGMLFGSF
jgi:hypothetical protein